MNLEQDSGYPFSWNQIQKSFVYVSNFSKNLLQLIAYFYWGKRLFDYIYREALSDRSLTNAIFYLIVIFVLKGCNFVMFSFYFYVKVWLQCLKFGFYQCLDGSLNSSSYDQVKETTFLH